MKKLAIIVCLLCLMVWEAYSVWTAISNTDCGTSGEFLNSDAPKICGTGWTGVWSADVGAINVETSPLGGQEAIAFPTTGILDNFNRTNSTNLGSGWTQINLGEPGANGPAIISNQVGSDQQFDYSIMYWNAGTFSGGVEAYLDITTKLQDDYDDAALFLIKTVSPLSGYAVKLSILSGTDELKFVRYDAGTATVLSPVIGQEFSNGDGLGMKIVGNTIQIFHRTGGTWNLKDTRTDTAYTAPFIIGFYASDSPAYRYDNFGGGSTTGSSLSIKLTGSGSQYSRAITAINVGAVRFLGRASTVSLSNSAGIFLGEGGASKMLVNFGPSGVIQIYNGGTAAYVPITSYVANQWYTIDVEFDDVAQANQYRARVDNGAWSSWLTVNGSTYTNINSFHVDVNNIGSSVVWIDDIKVMPISSGSAVPALFSRRRQR